MVGNYNDCQVEAAVSSHTPLPTYLTISEPYNCLDYGCKWLETNTSLMAVYYFLNKVQHLIEVSKLGSYGHFGALTVMAEPHSYYMLFRSFIQKTIAVICFGMFVGI